MNMTRASHRGSVDGNGQVRGVNQRRSVPMSVRQRGQTTARKLSRPRRIVDLRSEAARMIELICELFPLCRSITGDGLRQSLYRLHEFIPLETHEVASGTQVFDWTIPKEWNIQDAYIKDREGRRVVDFRVNTCTWSTTAPRSRRAYRSPSFVPTSIRSRSPGLDSLSHHLLRGLLGLLPVAAATRKLCRRRIRGHDRSSLSDGALTYGECVLPGQVEDEFLISTHVCHPSMANDNLSGVAVATALARLLALTSHRFTYRFLFVPGTIGPIAWLSRNQDKVSPIKHGLAWPAWAIGEASTISEVDASPRISTEPSSMSCAPRECPSRSETSRLTAMTRGNSVLQDLIFPSGVFGAPLMVSTRSITLRPMT